MSVNEPFLREVLAWIELHPERWDQATFARSSPCGTTHCLAGWAYVLGTGKEFNFATDSDVERVAKRLLGLTGKQAVELFFFVNVWTLSPDDEVDHGRPVTFEELCAKVEEVTGVRFKPKVELDLEPA